MLRPTRSWDQTWGPSCWGSEPPGEAQQETLAFGTGPCVLCRVRAALGQVRRVDAREAFFLPSLPPSHGPKQTPAAHAPASGHSLLGQLGPAQHGATQPLHIAQVHIVEVVSGLEESPSTAVTHPQMGCVQGRARPDKARGSFQLSRARGLGYSSKPNVCVSPNSR